MTEEELRRLEDEVPGLEDPHPDAYESRAAWEAAVRANEQTWNALYGEKARMLREMYQGFAIPQQTMTVRVCLDHARNLYQVIRRIPKARKNQGWSLAQWQAHMLDAERQARTRQLAKGGVPFAWNWLCVSAQSAPENEAFWLLLYLCQERMIEGTEEVVSFVTRYLRPFCKGLHEPEGQTQHPDHLDAVAGDPLLGIIYEVFGRLKHGYAWQAYEKGGPAYIWRVVRDLK